MECLSHRQIHCFGSPHQATASLSDRAPMDADHQVNSGQKKVSDFDGAIPTIGTIVGTTAILEAGRMSLDAGGKPFDLVYKGNGHYEFPVGYKPSSFDSWLHFGSY